MEQAIPTLGVQRTPFWSIPNPSRAFYFGYWSPLELLRTFYLGTWGGLGIVNGFYATHGSFVFVGSYLIFRYLDLDLLGRTRVER